MFQQNYKVKKGRNQRRIVLTVDKRWMDRSTRSETATNIVNTEATDHVGVKANDRSSLLPSSIPSEKKFQIDLSHNWIKLYHQLHKNYNFLAIHMT